jgi:hypothetical protein
MLARAAREAEAVQRADSFTRGQSSESHAVERASAADDGRLGRLGPGDPIDAATRDSFESYFGADFTAVRLHAGPAAAAVTGALGADAVTVGSHVAFGPRYRGPAGAAGRRTLAHELTHVVQQRTAGTADVQLQVADPTTSSLTPEAVRGFDDAALTRSIATLQTLVDTPMSTPTVDSARDNLELMRSELHRRQLAGATPGSATAAGGPPLDLQKLFSEYATKNPSFDIPQVDIPDRQQLLKIEFKPILDSLRADYRDAKEKLDSNTKNAFGTGRGLTLFPGMSRTGWDQSNALLNRENVSRRYEQSKKSLDQVMQIVGVQDESEIPEIENDFIATFRSKARAVANFMLDQSERVAQAEYARYSTIPTDRCTNLFSELHNSCQYIANFQYELVNLMNTSAAIYNAEAPWGYPEAPTNTTADNYYETVNSQGFSTDHQVRDQYRAFKAAISQEGAKFPVLLKEKLNYIKLGYEMTEDQLRNSVMGHAVDVLNNIKESRKDIDDSNIWDLTPVITATVELFGIQESSYAQAVLTKYLKDRARNKSLLDLFLAAVGVVLAIVATIGSGGLAAFAIVGGAAIGGYQAYQHYGEYKMQMATRGSAFDITKAVGGNFDPSALSVAFDVGLTLFSFVQAASALRGLKSASAAARLGAEATALERAGASVSTLDFTTNLKRFTNAEGFTAEVVGDDLIRITHPSVEGEFILSRSSLRYQTPAGTGVRVEFEIPVTRERVPGQLGAGTDEFEEQLSQTLTGGQNEGIYDTAQRLVRGNIGEKLAADVLATRGHRILSFKPSILGTNQGGIDIVTIENGVVYLIDNKALTKAGNIGSVSALTTNFNQNLASVRRDLQTALAVPGISADEAATLQQAVTAIDNGNYVRAVTNANISRDTQVLTGVTDNLAGQGIQFINVR